MTKRTPAVDMARVIRDTRDASRDYFIPRARARELFERGELVIDKTNTKDNEVVYGDTGRVIRDGEW
jgi:hypothetical protein